ncbi:MAG: xanthine dehydrogenase molybdopterin binding subunit [Bacteroidetes bacterium HGW-Bacteroidetes-1]|jgi:xanthine dehydrogenase molybdopterin binding subunit|nr:MAG: xanthine dehydrogenase molybdopterin binding subunit [Bacteroidetes bacterium HGW-Bacteroidetes-1]
MNSIINSDPHESAVSHVTGKAVYVADMLINSQVIVGHVVFSPYAHARILEYDFTDAIKVKGVIDILDYNRIPGVNQLNSIAHDEPCLAREEIHCIGQAMFLIAALNEKSAIEAEKKIKIKYEVLKPILSIEEAIEQDSRMFPTRRIETGSPDDTLLNAPHVLEGQLDIGGQEHWYLETQAALCVPGEDREMTIYASSQNPTETQLVVAEVLGLNANQVLCEVKRMGGGFGGKETQANHIAAWAALLADATNRPVKIVMSRDNDQKYTGKRHSFKAFYKIGFDHDGRIISYIVDLHGNAGMNADLSMPILERALFHSENSYFIPNMRVRGTMWKTNMPSNTAFRGFGGPQGMAVIENAIDRMARFLHKDASEIRFMNFYGVDEKNITHYGQHVIGNRLFLIWDRLIKTSQYFDRRIDITAFNNKNRYIKRGIALTPVKFGISFTTSFLNQAGALVNVYKDGTVLVNHGGTEMGQGLHTKIKAIASSELGLPLSKIQISATNTSKVPNTSPTAASSGTDLNGMAVKNAIDKLKERFKPLVLKMLNCNDQNCGIISYENEKVFLSDQPEHSVGFYELVKQVHKNQISLSATGFYGTPNIFFDRDKGKGKPFHYYAFGMAVSEVEVDILTGMSRILRSDILHDAGSSINEAVDLGQVTGGFIQGVGWCTTETLRYNSEGHLLNHSPDTYKIPGIGDMPLDFRVELLRNAPNPMAVHQSKAVGEPPLMLAFSVWLAIKDAISAVADHGIEPEFSLPANNEVILLSAEKLRNLSDK